jgi:hypothetical protein
VYNQIPAVVLTPGNAATEALGLYVSSVTDAGFTISAANAPSASQADTVYSVTYMVLS